MEIDPDWQMVVKSQAPDNALFVGVPVGKYDLFLIDGEPVEVRRKWLTAARDLVTPGGWVVLDNANRPEYAAEHDALAEFAELVKVVDGNAETRAVHTKYLVTEFWKVKDASRTEPKQSRRRTNKH
jgi:predicted O-methyltransferase YrrM